MARLTEALNYFAQVKDGLSDTEADSDELKDAQKEIGAILKEFKSEMNKLKRGQDSDAKEAVEAIREEYDALIKEAREQCKKARDIAKDSEKARKKKEREES